MPTILISEENKKNADKVRADLLMQGKDSSYNTAVAEMYSLWEQVNISKTLKVIPK